MSLRLANVYDLSSKILLLKFAKPDVKKQMLIDSGFRCHLTDFARTTAAAPSAFVARLRKFLKTRRLTSVSQIGTDRIIEFQFSDGQYRLFLEFFASGNVILTDADLKILTLLRNVPEGESQEPQRIGLSYSLENRQNFAGVPPLTKERLRNALQSTIDRAAKVAPSAKKKSKPGDELRKGLAVTINELPPMLLDHAFQTSNFNSTMTSAEVLADDSLLDQLLNTLNEASKVVKDITSAEKTTGYIIAKYRTEPTADVPHDTEPKREDLLYEDFHPFLPAKFANNPQVKVLTFEGFNKTADEFFSSLEGQKLESKLSEREAAAQRKIEAARQDHAKRIEGLQEAQSLNEQKASAIEANVERVQEAMDAVNGLLEQGMDWVNINKLIEREQKRGNPVAEIIKLPLNLGENTITLLIGSEDVEAEDDAYETGSDDSDDEGDSDEGKKTTDNRLAVEINLTQSPWSNARDYYDQRRTAAVKEQKTSAQSSMALKNAEQKIAQDLKKGLKQEKAVLQPIRSQMWFEKFIWFISSDGYLVLGGKDAQQAETLYKRHLRKGDIFVHAEMPGAATVVIKNKPETPDAPIPPSTLSQAGMLSVCSSNAWDSKAGMGAWWVNADQVSKAAATGEYLAAGSFTVRGAKNYLPPAPLLLGLGIMFKISDGSKSKHTKHRVQDTVGEGVSAADASVSVPFEGVPDDENGSDEEEDLGDSGPRANPLQGAQERDDEDDASDGEQKAAEAPLEAEVQGLAIADEESSLPSPQSEENADEEVEAEDTETLADTVTEAGADRGSPAPWSSRASTVASEKKAVPKRGQRSKAKKAAKYKDQDEEDRLAAEAVIGAARGREKAEAEAQARAKKEAEIAAQKERRRIALEREQKKTAEHEERRRHMREQGVEMLDEDEAEKETPLDSLVGIPLVGDEIVEAIPVCAPWNALGKFKYKVKFQPGSVKKGKAVKECLEMWKAAAGKKGVVDEKSADTERMWPREVELLKALKAEEVINSVPVGKVRLMLTGGLASGGGGGGGGKGGPGKGKGGNRGQKKK